MARGPQPRAEARCSTPSARWVMGVSLALALACGGTSAEPMNSTSGGPVEVPPWACVPGETLTCDCPDDLDGVQTCNPEGSGFGECDCSPSAVSQGPPATSTGTGSGSDTAGTAEDTATDTGPEPTTGGATTVDPGSTTDPDPTTGGPGSTGPGGTTGGTTGGGSSTG